MNVVFEEKDISSQEYVFSAKFLATILLYFFTTSNYAQVVSPFDIRFQANQKGGIEMISNVALTCNSSNPNCGTFQNQFPPNGNHNQDGGIIMDYVDIDNSASTFMSSSDSLALPSCSEVSWAGLYWSARIQENTTAYVNRENVKIKLNDLFYQNITADETIDVQNIPGNPSFGMPSYFCFKDITPLVQASGGNGRFTLANISSRTGDENLFAAWTIVVVYKNELESLRNLTVFDGMVMLVAKTIWIFPFLVLLHPAQAL